MNFNVLFTLQSLVPGVCIMNNLYYALHLCFILSINFDLFDFNIF